MAGQNVVSHGRIAAVASADQTGGNSLAAQESFLIHPCCAVALDCFIEEPTPALPRTPLLTGRILISPAMIFTARHSRRTSPTGLGPD